MTKMAPPAAGLTWLPSPDLTVLTSLSSPPGPRFSGLVAPPPPGAPCPEWSTAWGPCSTTCGLGVATRVSNQNRLCRLETQRRLCLPGPCPLARGRSPWNRAF